MEESDGGFMDHVIAMVGNEMKSIPDEMLMANVDVRQ